MVTIVGYQKRKNEEEKEFFVLILQSGIEVIKSQTGGMYATAKKASLPSTFTEETCRQLIGQELTGRIKKVDCEPYEFVIPDTSEVITRSHRYEYSTEDPEL
ncbi:hypothetical protein [Pedobacter sp. UBA4863]|uniref:hypothetical protein n=1 Tax=Pedobacter sp. UBA4863 TaxID=1947060 RepID=UPI0025DC8045|nr:hypothetical protein [Pedobacter sp. UBA4863]